MTTELGTIANYFYILLLIEFLRLIYLICFMVSCNHGAVTNYMIYRKWNLVETSEYGFNILKNCLNNLFEFH